MTTLRPLFRRSSSKIREITPKRRAKTGLNRRETDSDRHKRGPAHPLRPAWTPAVCGWRLRCPALGDKSGYARLQLRSRRRLRSRLRDRDRAVGTFRMTDAFA